MKKLSTLLSLFAMGLLLFTAGCKLVDITHDINGGSVTFTIETQVKGSYEDVNNATIDLKSELEKYNVSLDKLSKLQIKSATFTLIDGSSSPVTFDVVDNAILEVGSSSASLPLKKIAWKDPVPHTGLSILAADVDNSIDVLPYAKAADVQYRVAGVLNSDIDHPIDIKVEITWTVEF
jgi:hypothetical protein